MHVNSSSHFLWPRRKSFSPLSFVREVLVPSFFVKKCPSPSYFVKKKSFHSLFGEKCMPLRFCQKNPWLSFFKKTLGTLVVRANQSFYKFWVVLNGLHIFWIKLSYGAGQRLFSPLREGAKFIETGTGQPDFPGAEKSQRPVIFSF